MGMIMTEAHRPQVGEHHYRWAMKLIASPSPVLVANLAWNLRNQGRMAESRQLYQESVRLDPAVFQTLYGWARMEENPSVLLNRAILHGRLKASGRQLFGRVEQLAGTGEIAVGRHRRVSPFRHDDD